MGLGLLQQGAPHPELGIRFPQTLQLRLLGLTTLCPGMHAAGRPPHRVADAAALLQVSTAEIRGAANPKLICEVGHLKTLLDDYRAEADTASDAIVDAHHIATSCSVS